MSSYIMHICISDIVRKKHNLSTKFIYGSILPDILKQTGADRNTTHYIEKTSVDDETRDLPDIPKAIRELKDVDMDKEIKMGYIAHLVEDYIWFNKYIPSYAKKTDVGTIQYTSDGSVHTSEEFSKDMYLDYYNAGTYVIDKCKVDIEGIRKTFSNLIKDKDKLEVVLKYTEYSSQDKIEENKFMIKESIDEYISEATEEVEKIVEQLLGEL